MKTRLSALARYRQDGVRPDTEASAKAQRRRGLAPKSLNAGPNSMSTRAGSQTPPRERGFGAGGKGVAGYRPHLAGAPKQKIKKADTWLDALAAELLDLDPILTAAVMLGGDDE